MFEAERQSSLRYTYEDESTEISPPPPPFGAPSPPLLL